MVVLNDPSARSYPRSIATDERFRRLTGAVRDMCYDGRLQARQVANIMHAVGKMSAAGKLATDDVDIQDTLVSLGKRVGPDR